MFRRWSGQNMLIQWQTLGRWIYSINAPQTRRGYERPCFIEKEFFSDRKYLEQ